MKKNDRIFSIFKVYDYKGGELSTSVNIPLDGVIGELLESNIVSHPEVDCWGDFFELEDDRVDGVCKNLVFSDDTYAGGDGVIIEVFEHIGNKLKSRELSFFNPFFAEYIKKNKE